VEQVFRAVAGLAPGEQRLLTGLTACLDACLAARTIKAVIREVRDEAAARARFRGSRPTSTPWTGATLPTPRASSWRWPPGRRWRGREAEVRVAEGDGGVGGGVVDHVADVDHGQGGQPQRGAMSSSDTVSKAGIALRFRGERARRSAAETAQARRSGDSLDRRRDILGRPRHPRRAHRRGAAHPHPARASAGVKPGSQGRPRRAERNEPQQRRPRRPGEAELPTPGSRARPQPVADPCTHGGVPGSGELVRA
jgi:hypothetical protein